MGSVPKIFLHVSQAMDIRVEGGGRFFRDKYYYGTGRALSPIKAGFRYTRNGSSAGFYLQIQLGYHVYVIADEDNNFTGLV